jgi:hypothetical protein
MSLPKLIPLEEKKEQVAMRMVICISKDIDELEEKVLADYGKVIRYEHDLHNNIDSSTLSFDYLIIDLRKKDDRYFYMKEILNKRDKYHVVLYNYCFEESREFDCDNQINSFPKKQANKKDFDALLLIKRIKQPRAWVDLFRKCFGLYKQLS